MKNCNSLLTLVIEHLTKNTKARLVGEACRIDLPLLEPNGDGISVYIEERGNQYMIHDGGHIAGLLFQAGPAGASNADKRTIDNLMEHGGFKKDDSKGVFFVLTGEGAIAYWILELGRIVSVAASMIPGATLPKRRSRRLGPVTAAQIVKRLIDEQLMEAIHPPTGVRGISKVRTVDLYYTIPQTPIQQERTVFVLALDLNAYDPVARANRGITTAADLIGQEDTEPIVRVVYGTGDQDGEIETARKLISVGAKKKLFEDFWWDDLGEQARFVTKVREEVSPLLNSVG